MSITVVARKMLWGRAGNRCAWPGCGQRLIAAGNDDELGTLVAQGLVVGEEAHIRSGRPGGPRHDPSFPESQIDTYANLILLCPTHHTVIDRENGAGWPVDKIIEMKEQHEFAIEHALSAAARNRQSLDERVAAQLAVWEEKLGIRDKNDWENLTFGLNRPIPFIRDDRLERLLDVGRWLLSRDWPRELPKLRIAFGHHFAVITTLVDVLDTATERRGGSGRGLIRGHKSLGRWDPPEYERLLRQSNVWAVTIGYLASELARSTNLVIAAVRDEFDPLYRLDEGFVLSRYGDGIIVNQLLREEYDDWDWEKPSAFPSVEQIHSAIVTAAGPDDPRVQSVNPRTLRPQGGTRHR